MRYVSDIAGKNDAPDSLHAPRRKILLGITGGVAAYKAAELVRRLGDRGIEVHVVMTEAACGFITPATLQALSGHPVYTSMWDGRISNGMPHIELSRDKDAIVVAPATADFIAKCVHGLADDLLSTLCLARDCPLIVAPAMNRQMWEHPATQRNVARLRQDGVTVLGPDSGDQACGETGMGRMLEAEELAEAVAAFGLVATILGGIRFATSSVPWLVGLYITAAYWFTASTSFANPAVTVGRALSDTFAGIAPGSAPAFIAAQVAGALAAMATFGWLLPRETRA